MSEQTTYIMNTPSLKITEEWENALSWVTVNRESVRIGINYIPMWRVTFKTSINHSELTGLLFNHCKKIESSRVSMLFKKAILALNIDDGEVPSSNPYYFMYDVHPMSDQTSYLINTPSIKVFEELEDALPWMTLNRESVKIGIHYVPMWRITFNTSINHSELTGLLFNYCKKIECPRVNMIFNKAISVLNVIDGDVSINNPYYFMYDVLDF